MYPPESSNQELYEPNKSILIVHNEVDITTLIKPSLQKLSGFHIFGFTDPLVALEHFHANNKDYVLVLSDIKMAGMTGFEFARKVRKINPTVKFLLMSTAEINDPEFSDVDFCSIVNSFLSVKVDGFIQKPISMRELNS